MSDLVFSELTKELRARLDDRAISWRDLSEDADFGNWGDHRHMESTCITLPDHTIVCSCGYADVERDSQDAMRSWLAGGESVLRVTVDPNDPRSLSHNLDIESTVKLLDLLMSGFKVKGLKAAEGPLVLNGDGLPGAQSIDIAISLAASYASPPEADDSLFIPPLGHTPWHHRP